MEVIRGMCYTRSVGQGTNVLTQKQLEKIQGAIDVSGEAKAEEGGWSYGKTTGSRDTRGGKMVDKICPGRVTKDLLVSLPVSQLPYSLSASS